MNDYDQKRSKPRKTFTIDDDVAKRFQNLTASQGYNQSEVVEALMRGYIKGNFELKTETETKIITVTQDVLVANLKDGN